MSLPALLIALLAPVGGAGAKPSQAAEPPSHLTCHETTGSTQWRLEFDWAHETVLVSRRAGASDAWEAQFKDSAAVHVYEGDGTLLVETSLKEWVGPGESGAACGRRIETLFFDLLPKGGHFVGKLEKTPRWQDRDDESCGPAPEELSVNVRLECDPG